MIMSLNDHSPKIPKSAYIAPNASIIGDVNLGENSSVWFNCVIRGDVNKIEIGNNTNIQDGTIIHGRYKKSGTYIGDGVSVGHGVILHACQIKSNCLIGMGAIIMDEAVISENSLVGAGSLVTQGSHFEEESLIMGSPAKFIRKLNQDEIKSIKESSSNYLNYKTWYSKG